MFFCESRMIDLTGSGGMLIFKQICLADIKGSLMIYVLISAAHSYWLMIALIENNG